MRGMDEEQAVLEHLTLCDSKMWISTALKIFKNYRVIISVMLFSLVTNFLVNSTVVFEHFENFKKLILKILMEKLVISCLQDSFYLKIVESF